MNEPVAADPLPGLRRQMRGTRRAVPSHEARAAARRLARNALHIPALRAARRIALYWPADGEISPAPLMQRLWDLGRDVLLPVLPARGQGRLRFASIVPGSPLRDNRFGIPEPDCRGNGWPLRSIDVVCLPLVAFDASGTRLGMGGGYYDRALARLRDAHWRHPKLVGLAYAFQEVARLPRRKWDIPLDIVVTDRGGAIS